MEYRNLVAYSINKGLEKAKMAKVLKNTSKRFKPEKLVELKAKQKAQKTK
jgi:hypothetical protein